MSYSKFLDDLNIFYKERQSKGVTDKIHRDEALSTIRDNWIQQDKIKELISFIHTNWDSGNCDDFIAPLETFLIKTNQIEQYNLLWTKIINYRLTALWQSLEGLKKEFKNFSPSEIGTINVADFNMFSKDSYKNIKRVVAFRRMFAIEGLTKMKNGLQVLGEENRANEIEEIIRDVIILKRPKIKL